MNRAAAALVLLALVLVARPSAAIGDPDLEWWTIETAHFRVHHPHTLEPIAARVAALAETIHGRLTVTMGHTPDTVTEIVLNDTTDSANGSATSLPYNTIRLFVTAPDDMSPLGDYDDWFLELLTHEYTHILHTDNISGVASVINAVLGRTIAPNQIQPRWVLEGLAVVHESGQSSAGRLRASLFDMILRADFLEDNVARLDQVSNVTHRWPQGTLWYLYGSRFLSWISAVYGEDTMRAVAVDYGASIIPWGINRAIRRATGRTYVELYEGFKDHTRRHYAQQMAAVKRRGLREGVRLTSHARETHYPRFVPPSARSKPGREEIAYYKGDSNDRGGIYRLPVTQVAGGAPLAAAGEPELWARTAGGSLPSFSPDGGLVFNSSSTWKDVYARDDLYALPPGETAPGGHESARRRLTTGMRATAADVSPDGRQVVFTMNDRGTTYLRIADRGPDGALSRHRNLVPSARFQQAFTPRFSPDGTKVAYSAWTAGGFRDVRVVDVKTGAFERITHDRALDQQPSWSPDQRTLYFASDRGGIYNIYAHDLATRKLAQVTNVETGAFQPAVSPDGKTLVYVGYGAEGYDLHAMRLDPARYLEPLPPPTDRPDPPAEPSAVPLRRSRYNPWPTVAPHSYFVALAPGSYGTALTVTATGSDVVGSHGVAASVTFDFDAPSPSFNLDYVYGRLPVDMSLRLFHTVAPRTGFRVNNRVDPYDEYTTGVTAGLSRPISEEFSTHGVGLSYTAASFQGDLPIGRGLDPYATRTVDPPQGFVGLVHLGYGYSNAEGSLDASGPTRGVTFNVGFDVADEAIGSEFSLRAFEYSAAAYITMPWPGWHTLALRSSGAVASGTYGRAGIYSVGGYDLETNTIVDTVATGVFNAAFVLRGYPSQAFVGRQYLLETAEYRFPLLVVDRGVSTLPVFLRRIDGNLFVDYGGAFAEFDPAAIRIFHDGYLIDTPQLHASVGGELWFNLTLGYYVNTQMRLGYAYGFSSQAIPGGQLYFVAASAF